MSAIGSANFNPSSGLRGVCALLIVAGHFFDFEAPRRLRYFGFDASVAGCELFDTAKEMPQCYPSAVLDEALRSSTPSSLMYMTPVALFFAISGALFAYLYYDTFHILEHTGGGDEVVPTHTQTMTWFAFLSKRYRRIAPQLWVSLVWLSPFFLFDVGA